MTQYSGEMLSRDRAIELWPQLEPVLQKAASAHVKSDGPDLQYIFNALCLDEVAVFAYFMDGVVSVVLVIQFFGTDDNKVGASIIALGGSGLLHFKHRYWHTVLDWLKANDVSFLDSHVPLKHARMYEKKFGFSEVSAYVRMPLEVCNG
jgi:hypothetical protein